jgi:hypothetical protein
MDELLTIVHWQVQIVETRTYFPFPTDDQHRLAIQIFRWLNASYHPLGICQAVNAGTDDSNNDLNSHSVL